MSKIKPSQKRKSKKPVSRPNKSIIKKCKNSIKNRNVDPSTFFNYAGELNKLGDTNGALKYYLKGLKRNPNNNTALINMSLILIDLFVFAQAIIYLTRAITHTPQQFTAYIYRSIAFLGEGKKAEAYQDFKFVYENYPDKIHHFSKMDKTSFSQIDFDEAMEYCQYPAAVFRPWNTSYFPTVDCPVDEICLQKEYCQQKDVCPQNDMALFQDIILRQKLSHPRDLSVETVLMDIDEEMANSVSVDLLPVPHHVSKFQKLLQYFHNLKNQLSQIFNFVFLCLILPLNEILQEYEVIVDI